jgi:multimeric flavodoxin WrbA
MSLADGIRKTGIETDCKGIDEIDIDRMSDYDFVAIGGPTHMIGISKGLKEFLEKLRGVDLRGKFAFSFDTRNESRMNKRSWMIFENSAARRIEGKMKGMKMKIIHPRESALVTGREGPLESGVDERFVKIGRAIADAITT